MSTKLYRKIRLTWKYPIQHEPLEVGTVRIVRSLQPFTVDNYKDQVQVVVRDYTEDFTSYDDTDNLEKGVTYYYMIILHEASDESIIAATELYEARILLKPEDIEPMIVTFNAGGAQVIYSHSPLKITSLSSSEIKYKGFIESGLNYEVQELYGQKLYMYHIMINHEGYYGCRVKVTHADGVSPINWISFLYGGNVIEQWYTGGYERFSVDIDSMTTWLREHAEEEYGATPEEIEEAIREVEDELLNMSGLQGFGHYQLPMYAPPNTTNFDYMFYGKLVPPEVKYWDMSKATSMRGMFRDSILTEDLDLSSWCVPNITEEPAYFSSVNTSEYWETTNNPDNETVFTITNPVWGTCPKSLEVPSDEDSMIFSLMLDTAYLLSDTKLEIKSADDHEYIIELNPTDDENSFSHLVNYIYRIIPSTPLLTYGRKIKVRPESGEGPIKNFGSQGFWKLDQWWSGGYDGFIPHLGTGTTLLPAVAPPNTTNLSYILSMYNVATGELSDWDVSGVTDMSYLFYNHALGVYTKLSNWDVSNVTNMSSMFYNSPYFGDSISDWNVSNVKYMDNMFGGVVYNYEASSYDPETDSTDLVFQDLSQWCVGNILTKPKNFVYGDLESNLPLANQPVWGTCPRGEKDFTTDPSIGEGEVDPDEVDAFVVYSEMGYLYIYTTGDLDIEVIGGGETPSVTDAGYYKVYMYTPQIIQSTSFNIRPVNSEKIPAMSCMYVTKVEQWYPKGHEGFTVAGTGGLGTMLREVPRKAPRNTTSFAYMFTRCSEFNQDISSWEVSAVTDMTAMFSGAESFNQDLSGWCVSNIRKLPRNFADGSALTDPIKLPVWGTCPSGILPPAGPEPKPEPIDLGDAYVLKGLTANALEVMVIGDDVNINWGPKMVQLEQEGPMNYGGFNIVTYTAMYEVYSPEEADDVVIAITNKNPNSKLPIVTVGGIKEIVQWSPKGHVGFGEPTMFGYLGVGGDIVKVPGNAPVNTTDLSGLFAGATSLNDPVISSWDVSGVTAMDSMFAGCSGFAQDLSGWCVSNIAEEPEYFNDGGLLPDVLKPTWGTCPVSGTRYEYTIDGWKLDLSSTYTNDSVRFTSSKAGKTSWAEVGFKTVLTRVLKTDWGKKIDMVRYGVPGNDFEIDTVNETIVYQEFYWDANNNPAYKPVVMTYDDLVTSIITLVSEEESDENWYKSMFNNFLTAIVISAILPENNIDKVIFDSDLKSQFNNNSN